MTTDDKPRAKKPEPTWHQAHKAQLTLGQRAADKLRNGMGSWIFVFSFLGVMALWAILNSLGIKWDPYPFILLNLFLSMLAGLQGAILLISAKRQDSIAAALAQHDYNTDKAARKDIDALMVINQQQLVMIHELHELLVIGAAVAAPRNATSAKKPLAKKEKKN
ncbi:MAG: hypothetical protein QOI02_1013 [Actinomycetota bacterium]|nr:hypothetical protein [Glaciihabitans sp.]MDQ1556011.1 hypothetical protein [Actinomycetota bacterium]